MKAYTFFTQWACLLLAGMSPLHGNNMASVEEWYGQLAMHGIASPSDLTWRIGLIAILHLTWPLALLYVALKIPY
jgi:hypothetical protein